MSSRKRRRNRGAPRATRPTGTAAGRGAETESDEVVTAEAEDDEAAIGGDADLDDAGDDNVAEEVPADDGALDDAMDDDDASGDGALGAGMDDAGMDDEGYDDVAAAVADDTSVDGAAGGAREEPEQARATVRRRRSGPGPFRRMYRGETSFDFVGRRRMWLAVSAVIIFAGIVSLGFRGLNLGITFRGGEAWTVKAPGVTQVQALDAVQAVGLNQATVEIIGTGSAQVVRVTADLNSLTTTQARTETQKVIGALASMANVPRNSVSVTTVGPTWGGEVTQKAVIALIVFLVLVAVYISIRFEPKMAVAAFVALLHDLLVTAGVYSLAGFQVTPDTVIAVLTILGYSLYDTVVVFDRVRDNTKGLGSSGRMTYSEMVNLSMNQTLARSINTSLVAILPVLSVLLIGAELLGATTLQNYGLALFVGLMSGAYSSIFIASPILAWLKEREPRYIAIRQRIEAKGDRSGLLTPRAAAAMLGAPGGSVGRAKKAAAPTLRPGQAKATARSASPARAAAPAATLERAGPGSDGASGGGPTPRSRPGGGAAPARRRPPQRSRKGGSRKRRR